MKVLFSERRISAGHDISDGGLLTSCLEMAFAGNGGINLHFDNNCKKLCLFYTQCNMENNFDNKNKVSLILYLIAGLLINLLIFKDAFELSLA